MLKTTIAVLLVSAAIQATPITTANPVPIDGSGWSLISGHKDNGLSATASGSNGVDFVSFNLTTWDGVGIFFSVNVGMNPYMIGGATVNGVGGSWMDLTIINGTGILNVYDFSRTLVAHADLIGFIEVTSLTQGPGCSAVCLSGDETYRKFSISSTAPSDLIAAVPEPATWFVVVPLLTIAARRKTWQGRPSAARS